MPILQKKRERIPGLNYKYTVEQMKDKEFVQALWNRYRDDPWLWITEQVFTIDESLRGDNVRRFPVFAYCKMILDEYFKNKITYVLKSRRMMITHLFSALWVHQLLFVKHSKNGVISTGKDTAEEFIQKRCGKIIEYLDPCFPYPVLRDGHEIMKSRIVNPAMGDSEIQAFPSRPKNMRGFTFTNCLADEGAFQDYFEENMDNAISPAVEGGEARAVAVSTPSPLTYFETKTDCPSNETVEQLMKNINWDNLPPKIAENSFHYGLQKYYNKENECVLLLHYTADPNKRTDEWYCENRFGTDVNGKRIEGARGTRKDKWNREYELSYAIPQGRRVVPEFDRKFHCQGFKGVLKDQPLHVGLDFGSIFPCVAVGQVDEHDRFHMIDSYMVQDITLKPFLKKAKDYVMNKYPDAQDIIWYWYCDPAGDNRDKDGVRADTAQQIAEDILGVEIQSVYSKPCDRARVFQELSSAKIGEFMQLIVNPSGGYVMEKNDNGEERETEGNLVAAFEKGWTYKKLKPGERYKKDEAPFKDGRFEHIMDAFGYMIIYLYQGLYHEAYRYRTGKTKGSSSQVASMAGQPRR